MQLIRIHTDGACSGNQEETNLGGWGAILQYGAHQKELFGGERNTTNNRMEMTALLQALNALKRDGQRIFVFSDSSYLTNCFREKWYERWLSNNWQTSKKTPVENRDLWEALLIHLHANDITFYRVKGHVNLKSKKLDQDALYRKFIQWNGTGFTREDFIAATEMNNRADELANRGIELLRSEENPKM